MPHLSTQEVEDVVATTLEYRIPTVVDNFYIATPVFKILDMEERITASLLSPARDVATDVAQIGLLGALTATGAIR